MSDIKLKPCPFCGGEATIMQLDSGHYVIGCDDDYMCLANINHKTMIFSSEEVAISHWNTRKPMDRIVEQLEEELNLADKEKERCLRENPLQFDRAVGYVNGIRVAIEVIKGGGVDE